MEVQRTALYRGQQPKMVEAVGHDVPEHAAEGAVVAGAYLTHYFIHGPAVKLLVAHLHTYIRFTRLSTPAWI